MAIRLTPEQVQWIKGPKDLIQLMRSYKIYPNSGLEKISEDDIEKVDKEIYMVQYVFFNPVNDSRVCFETQNYSKINGNPRRDFLKLIVSMSTDITYPTSSERKQNEEIIKKWYNSGAELSYNDIQYDHKNVVIRLFVKKMEARLMIPREKLLELVPKFFENSNVHSLKQMCANIIKFNSQIYSEQSLHEKQLSSGIIDFIYNNN